MVSPAAKPGPVGLPWVISTYFRPSADFGRTRIRESLGSGSTALSSFIDSSAVTRPLPWFFGVIFSTTPMRAPPMRTSLPLTSCAALGTSALSW